MENINNIPEKDSDLKLNQPEKDTTLNLSNAEGKNVDKSKENEVISSDPNIKTKPTIQATTLNTEYQHPDLDVQNQRGYPNNNHGRKTWKSYLFDFFMLFLAVFLGFLAQWQLELSSEHRQEREFILSLAEDLKKDTLNLNNYFRFNENIQAYCDSLQFCISRTDIFKTSNSFYNYSRELARYARYYPTDRTIQQLKNSGNMRLIRKWNVSNAITDYDGNTKSLIELDKQLNEQIIKYIEHLTEFLDLQAYDKLNPSESFMAYKGKTQGNPGFITIDSKRTIQFYNEAYTLKIFLLYVNYYTRDLSLNGKQLLDLLQNEYDFN